MLRSKIRFVLCLSILMMAWPSRGRAQPAADVVYSDVKDIITELIERDVAENVAPNLACYSPTGLLKYYPESLQTVYDRNFGALKDTLRRETIALVGNYAYQSFMERRSIPLHEFLPTRPFDPNDAETFTCAEAMKKKGGPAPYQDSMAREARARNDGVYYPLEACSVAVSGTLEESLPCHFAKAVVAAASGLPGTAEDLFGRAVAAGATELVLTPITTKALALPGARIQALRSALVEEFRARVTSGTQPVDGFLDAFEDPDLREAVALSKDGLNAADPFQPIFTIQSRHLRVLATALRLARRPNGTAPKLSVMVSGVPSGPGTAKEPKTWPMTEVIDFLRTLPGEAVAPAAGERRGCAVARALLSRQSLLPAGVIDVTTDGGALIKLEGRAGTSTPCTGPALATLEELFDIAQLTGKMMLLLQPSDKVDDPARDAILAGLLGAFELLEDILPTLKNAAKGSDGSFDVFALLKSVASGRLGKALCSPDAMDAARRAAAREAEPVKALTPCDLWTQAVGTLDPSGELRPILIAARDKNYRALAVSAIAAVFSEAGKEEICCGQGKSCAAQVELYGRFARSFASYVLMPRDDEDASLAGRQAFKAAAVDMIRSVRGRGSIQHNPTVTRMLIPTPALRASWSSSYRTPGEDNIRYIATLDWPSVRVRVVQDSIAYFGFAFSLIDGLAPLAENVSRNTNATATAGQWVLGFLQPRASGLFALPGLSDHVGIGAGVSIRGSGQVLDGDQLKYVTMFDGELVKLLEVSAGVIYVP